MSRRSRTARGIVATTLAVALASFAASPASAGADDPARGALDALAAVPGLAEAATTDSPADVRTDATGVSVTLPGEKGGLYELTLPDVAPDADVTAPGDGSTVITSSAADTDTVVQELGAGTRVIEVIGSSDAPTQFEYDLTVPAGMSLLPQEDGSIIVGSETRVGHMVTVDADAVIGAPWAVDAAGTPVSASYALGDDGTITMAVDHSDAVVYPVVADPTVTKGGFRATWSIWAPTTVTILLNKARTADAEDVGAVICIGIAFVPVVGAVIAAICGVHNAVIRATSRYGFCQKWIIDAALRRFTVTLYKGSFCS